MPWELTGVRQGKDPVSPVPRPLGHAGRSPLVIQKDLLAPRGSLITQGWRRTALERPPLSLAPCLLLTGPRCLVWGAWTARQRLGASTSFNTQLGRRGGERGAFLLVCFCLFVCFFNSSLAYHKISPWNHLPGQNSHAPGTKRVPSVGTPPPSSPAHPGRDDGVPPTSCGTS